MLLQCGWTTGAPGLSNVEDDRSKRRRAVLSGKFSKDTNAESPHQKPPREPASYFFSSVEVVVEPVVPDAPDAPSFIDDLKLRMPSPSPLPSSPNFLGPKMSRAINTMTASSGRPIFPPNIIPP